MQQTSLNKETYKKLLYSSDMIVRNFLENYLAGISSKEAIELRSLAASQVRHSELCDAELEIIKQREGDLAYQKNALVEQQFNDEFDQAQFCEIQKQIRKLFLQEKEWEYRKTFHEKIKSICLFLSQHLKTNVQQEIVELTQMLLDQMIDLYFSSKNQNGRLTLSKLDIKLQEARDAKDQTRVVKYMVQRKIGTLYFALSERNNELTFARIKALLLANSDAEQYLDKLEIEQAYHIESSRACISSMQDILSTFEEPGNKSQAFLDKAIEVFEFAQQQCFTISGSLLELNKAVQMSSEPKTELESKQLIIREMKCECKTHIYTLSIDLYLCQLDELQNLEPRYNECTKQVQEQTGIYYEEIFQQAIKLEHIIGKIQQSQNALNAKILEEQVKLQLLHQQAQLKSELLLSILRMGKIYLEMYSEEETKEEKFARFNVIYEHYNKEHHEKFIIGSETQLSISMQMNLAMQFLFIEYNLLSKLLAATLADYQITTEVLTVFTGLEAEDDDWSDTSDDDNKFSGMPTPPPIPGQEPNTELLTEGDQVSEQEEEPELPAQQDPPPPAPNRTPSPATM